MSRFEKIAPMFCRKDIWRPWALEYCKWRDLDNETFLDKARDFIEDHRIGIMASLALILSSSWWYFLSDKSHVKSEVKVSSEMSENMLSSLSLSSSWTWGIQQKSTKPVDWPNGNDKLLQYPVYITPKEEPKAIPVALPPAWDLAKNSDLAKSSEPSERLEDNSKFALSLTGSLWKSGFHYHWVPMDRDTDDVLPPPISSSGKDNKDNIDTSAKTSKPDFRWYSAKINTNPTFKYGIPFVVDKKQNVNGNSAGAYTETSFPIMLQSEKRWKGYNPNKWIEVKNLWGGDNTKVSQQTPEEVKVSNESQVIKGAHVSSEVQAPKEVRVSSEVQIKKDEKIDLRNYYRRARADESERSNLCRQILKSASSWNKTVQFWDWIYPSHIETIFKWSACKLTRVSKKFKKRARAIDDDFMVYRDWYLWVIKKNWKGMIKLWRIKDIQVWKYDKKKWQVQMSKSEQWENTISNNEQDQDVLRSGESSPKQSNVENTWSTSPWSQEEDMLFGSHPTPEARPLNIEAHEKQIAESVKRNLSDDKCGETIQDISAIWQIRSENRLKLCRFVRKNPKLYENFSSFNQRAKHGIVRYEHVQKYLKDIWFNNITAKEISSWKRFISPLSQVAWFWITAPFWEDRWGYEHWGLDIAPELSAETYKKFWKNIPILAMRDWEISEVLPTRLSWWYWEKIIIDHWDWYETVYAHLKKGSVKHRVGKKVRAWEVIASMWNTWRTRWMRNPYYPQWMHLHCEVRYKWEKMLVVMKQNNWKSFIVVEKYS